MSDVVATLEQERGIYRRPLESRRLDRSFSVCQCGYSLELLTDSCAREHGCSKISTAACSFRVADDTYLSFWSNMSDKPPPTTVTGELATIPATNLSTSTVWGKRMGAINTPRETAVLGSLYAPVNPLPSPFPPSGT